MWVQAMTGKNVVPEKWPNFCQLQNSFSPCANNQFFSYAYQINYNLSPTEKHKHYLGIHTWEGENGFSKWSILHKIVDFRVVFGRFCSSKYTCIV